MRFQRPKQLAWLHRRGSCGLVCLLAGLGLASPAAPAAEEVLHTISFPDNKEQIIIVRSVFPVSAPVTELVMPNWTPGSYLVREFARNLDSITVTDSTGAPLEVSKVAKDRWHGWVSTEWPGPGRVTRRTRSASSLKARSMASNFSATKVWRG